MIPHFSQDYLHVVDELKSAQDMIKELKIQLEEEIEKGKDWLQQIQVSTFITSKPGQYRAAQYMDLKNLLSINIIWKYFTSSLF